jgi:hypothetical protein
MGVRNYNTEGTQVADYGIGLSVDKNGVGTWTVSQPAAFRTAIDALSKTEINAYTWWGRALSNGVVNGDMTNVGNISFSASGKNIGGLMSFITAGNGTVGVGTLSPNTNYKLDVNGYTKTSRLYLSDTIYMVVQNDGIHIVGGGLYADTYVSALGLSDSGGSGGIDWDALAANTNEQINVSHLTTALAPYALTSQIPTSLKNPYKLTITLNGTPTEYDGSVARNLTINTGLDQQALTTYLSSKILTVKNGTATLGTWNPTAAGTIDIASAMAGYLPLTGGTLTGGVNLKFDHDLTKGDNGITSTQWYGVRVLDKNGYLSAQFLNQVQTDGTNALNQNLRNRNGGTEYDKSLMVYLTKSGVISAALNGVFTATSFNSTVATGTSPLTVASTTVVSNLNADLLDGYHANNVFQAAVQMMANANTSMTSMLLATITLPDSDSLSTGGFSAVFNSREMIGKNGFFLSLSIRRTNRTTIGCDFHYIPLGTVMPEVPYVRSDDGATFYVYMPSSGTGWRSYYAVTKINAENCSFNLETTDNVISGTRLNATAVMGGAVSSAAKLQNTRKIWGQNFDGSANVDGHLLSKGVYGGFALYSGFASGEAIRMEALDANGTWVAMGLTLLQNGNVGIGTNSPIVKFDVSGNARVTDKLYLYKPNAANDTGAVYLKYDTNNGGVHLVGGGLYADTYVSALGLSDSGGSAFDETAMWQALGTNITDKDIALAYIQTAADTRYALKTDIPTLSNLSWSYGNVTSASGNSYNGGAARSFVIPKNTSHLVNDSGFITSSVLGSYLPLTGGNLTGNLNIKYSHDLSKSNNGVSDTLWPGYRIFDKDGRRSAQFVNGVYSSGSNFVWMGVSNYDTSGNMIADYGIGLSVDKSGNAAYSVSEPAAFRTAIGIPALLGGYLPLTGGTMSGNIIGSNGSHFSVRMMRDTSNAVYGLEWLNTSNTHISGILDFNTEQKMILNATNAQDIW